MNGFKLITITLRNKEKRLLRNRRTKNIVALPHEQMLQKRREENQPIPAFREVEKNDNDHLMNLQYRYLSGDFGALDELYTYACMVCRKFIKDQKNAKGFYIATEDVHEKAHNAATYLIKQYITRSDFIVKTNIASYLFLRVVHELYYRTKVDAMLDFVDYTSMLENFDKTTDIIFKPAF